MKLFISHPLGHRRFANHAAREQSVVSASFRLFASAHIAVWQTLFATG
jgi:hypothetical protein